MAHPYFDNDNRYNSEFDGDIRNVSLSLGDLLQLDDWKLYRRRGQLCEGGWLFRAHYRVVCVVRRCNFDFFEG